MSISKTAGGRPLPGASGFAPELPAYIPSLDGLRAIAVSLVLLSHLIGTAGFPATHGAVGRLGTLGVRLFFVISGFLITTLLLKDVDRYGRLSLRRFYMRRVLRIFPAFYAYAGVIFLLNAAGVIALLPGDRLHALTYTMNYHHPHSWWLGHIWSLSVEEQFYLLWPAVVLLGGPRRAIRIAAGAVLVVPLLRMLTWYFAPLHRPAIGQEFHTIADAVAIGCCLAGAHNWLGSRGWYLRLLSSRWFPLVPLTALTVHQALNSRTRLAYIAGFTIVNAAITLTIDQCVRYPGTGWGRLLNCRPMRYIGALSYSLYLWQQPFLNRQSDWPAAQFPLNLALVIAAALASYYFVEQPFLALKDRLDGRMPRASGRVAAGGTAA